MKYRIVRHSDSGKQNYYQVERKRFLFWHPVRDCYGISILHGDVFDAKMEISNLKAKKEKVVVYNE